jgi:TRAP-type C4-dicarboxylate transport system permease small subunit
MEYFNKILRSTSHVGAVMGIVFMAAIGVTTTSNVILRFFNIAMSGYLEAIGLMMIVASIGAMSMAVFGKIQVAIDILISRLSSRKKEVFEIASLLVTLVFWGAILLATLNWIVGGAFKEQTDILKVPMLPFEILWAAGLLFFCMVYLRGLLEIVKERRIRK